MKVGWEVKLGVLLVLLSALISLVQFLIFHDTQQIFIYLLANIAFLPIQVLFVTLLINRLLESRERMERLKKLNLVIGVFFAEMGTHLLTYLSDLDPKLEMIKADLVVTKDWTGEEFDRVNVKLRGYDYGVDMKKVDLPYLKSFLMEKRRFLMRLSENPNLLEHESFTDLLTAVFHLTEEMAVRKNVTDLPAKDMEHLSADLKRVYTLIVAEWLNYMRHLKDSYPHMFSLAMRTNPFDQTASPIIKS